MDTESWVQKREKVSRDISPSSIRLSIFKLKNLAHRNSRQYFEMVEI